MSETRDVIVKLLTNIGSRKEVEQYLRHYAGEGEPKSAVVRVSGDLLGGGLDALASSLAFLHRVGLCPVVVHGGGLPLLEALARAGFGPPAARSADDPSAPSGGLGGQGAPPDSLDGRGALPDSLDGPDASLGKSGVRSVLPDVNEGPGVSSGPIDPRAVPPGALDVARRTYLQLNLRLVEALEALGVRARPFTSGVFEAEAEGGASEGAVARAHVQALWATVRAGHLPVVAPLAETARGQIVIAAADAAARALARSLSPHKVIFLNAAGGLVDGEGAVVPAVNLAEDYDALIAQPRLNEGSRRRFNEIAALLEELPPTSSVSITSPEHLAKELFTHGGAGTLVRRGERVRRYDGFEGVDRPRLRALLEACFGRALDEAYFEKKRPFRVYLADSYRATAILTREGEVPYLDKFAVTSEAQGEGIGGSIWRRVRAENPIFFWRARASNPINAWYAQQADGLVKSSAWWVFWCGLGSFDAIGACVGRALAMPESLRDHGSADVDGPLHARARGRSGSRRRRAARAARRAPRLRARARHLA
jgi:bifunctional N-acetylglutamate synthase/kinase